MATKRKFKLTYNCPVVLTYAVVCLVFVLVDMLTQGWFNANIMVCYGHPSWLNPMTYVRCVCHVFGHADWEHLLGTMMYLLILGPMLEEKYGTANIIFVMLVTAIVTGIINMIFFPYVHLLGASGIVFAFILLASITTTAAKTIPLTFILVAAMYIGQQIYQGIFVQDDISQLTHIVGGVVGSVLGFVMNRLKMNRYQR